MAKQKTPAPQALVPTSTSTLTPNSPPIVTDAPKTPTTAKIGNVLGGISIIVIILAVIVFLANSTGNSTTSRGVTTEELIPISTTEWTWVDLDPDKESGWADITDRNLDWFLAINGDTEHPIRMSLNGTYDIHVGDGIKKLAFHLAPGQGVQYAKIRFKRTQK